MGRSRDLPFLLTIIKKYSIIIEEKRKEKIDVKGSGIFTESFFTRT